MNAEIPMDEIFGGYIDEGKRVAAVRRGRWRRVICGFFLSFAAVTYGSGVYVLAEEVMKTEHLTRMVSAVLSAEAAEEVSAENEVTVKIEKAPSEDTSAEEEETAPLLAEYSIVSADLSCGDLLALANQTDYDPDTESLAAKAASADTSDDPDSEGPLVLVIHTHGTESYTPEGESTYTEDTAFRSADRTENMIAVGEEVCRGLDEAGIRAIHCAEMFDEESYVDSYAKSAAAIADYMEKYPSVKYVLDVHRDAIFKQDMTLLAPVTDDGAAQVMLVCGTDEMGADFPDWEENLAFALAVQTAAEGAYPGFMRNINLRGASFNQQMAEHFLLVEIGSAGNTLAQAKEAGYRFGKVFAQVIGD